MPIYYSKLCSWVTYQNVYDTGLVSCRKLHCCHGSVICQIFPPVFMTYGETYSRSKHLRRDMATNKFFRTSSCRFFLMISPLNHRVCDIKKNLEGLVSVYAFWSKKLNLFITYTTLFRTFQSLRIKFCQYKSLYCCHTLKII